VVTKRRTRLPRCKIGFDDNALYRHPDIVALRDLTEEDEKEIEASIRPRVASTGPLAAWSTARG
jgi:succinyl-CoA synthetase beta subunit